MSAAHTLWWFKDEGQPDYLDGIKSQYTIATVDGRVIAYAFQEEPARLIAAAPALLDLLCDALEIIDDQMPGEFPAFSTDARAAISLAKGEAK